MELLSRQIVVETSTGLTWHSRPVVPRIAHARIDVSDIIVMTSNVSGDFRLAMKVSSRADDMSNEGASWGSLLSPVFVSSCRSPLFVTGE